MLWTSDDERDGRMTGSSIEKDAINTIRFLAADGVQRANSGHPGMPMAMAPAAYVLWARHMNFNPRAPGWVNRDRFILSAGHGSMLLYAMLHLTGYDLSMDELKRFRQMGSKTAGHPEFGEIPGIEMTTGPLGQGFASGVGMAIAAAHQAAIYNREGFPIFDHYIYAIVSDGDLMEGVASEAASLAGHFKLGRLIYIYDDNRISIDGSTDLTFTEDRRARFEAYGWDVSRVEDVNDIDALDMAISAAKNDPRPSLIMVRSRIGFGLPTKEGTAAAHGEPPGEEELAGAKRKLNWPLEPAFFVPEGVRAHFEQTGNRAVAAYQAWESMRGAYRKEYPDLSARLERTLKGDLPDHVEDLIPRFPADAKGLATRASSGKVLNAIAAGLPELIGGSADLTGSNKTDIAGEGPFSPGSEGDRYLHFGVREHGMGAIMNGIGLYGGLIPYGGTFLVFSDYLRPAIRLAALMGLRVIYVFTHDSIGLGEDGPTHQPVEHLAALRSIPNLTLIRPADANEVAQAWRCGLERIDGPTALALTRQAVPTYDRERYGSAEGLRRGAYVLGEFGGGEPEVILMASGSEVQIIMNAGERLGEMGIKTRVVSFPSWELFEEQEQAYREEVLPGETRLRLAVEAGISMGWERWVGEEGVILGIDRFGISAPYEEIYAYLGLTVDHVVQEVEALISG
jgi:transketolase